MATFAQTILLMLGNFFFDSQIHWFIGDIQFCLDTNYTLKELQSNEEGSKKGWQKSVTTWTQFVKKKWIQDCEIDA